MKELFDYLCNHPLPATDMMFAVGYSEKEEYFNAVLKGNEEDLVKMFYSLYNSSEPFKNAIHALVRVIDDVNLSRPCNTTSDTSNAEAEFRKALEEIGIYSLPDPKYKS